MTVVHATFKKNLVDRMWLHCAKKKNTKITKPLTLNTQVRSWN